MERVKHYMNNLNLRKF